NEIGANWLLAREHILGLYETYSTTAAADDIAWLLATNGIRGECEGDVPCYVSWKNQLEGDYLRRQPAGRHADEANWGIAESLNGAMDNLLRFPKVLAEFRPA